MNAKTTPVTENWTPLALREMVYSFQKSRAFLTAYEFALFTIIGDEEKTSEEIAVAIHANRRATDRLLNAIVGMGLLEKHDRKYSNTGFSKKHLVKSSPGYLGGMAHAESLWRNWNTLTASVIAGTSVIERRFSRSGDDPLRGFIAAMHERARTSAPAIAANMDWTGVHRILDLGGGSGDYAMAFVREAKQATATVFDLPVVIPLTLEYITAAGLSDRIDTVAGDYLTDDLGTGFDLVFLSAIIHSNSYNENKQLIAKCAAALKVDGRIVIQDFIMDDNRTSPAHGALFALNMLVATNAGDTYTETEISEWLDSAGFYDFTRVETGFGTAQIIAKK